MSEVGEWEGKLAKLAALLDGVLSFSCCVCACACFLLTVYPFIFVRVAEAGGEHEWKTVTSTRDFALLRTLALLYVRARCCCLVFSGVLCVYCPYLLC